MTTSRAIEPQMALESLRSLRRDAENSCVRAARTGAPHYSGRETVLDPFTPLPRARSSSVVLAALSRDNLVTSEGVDGRTAPFDATTRASRDRGRGAPEQGLRDEAPEGIGTRAASCA